MGIRRYSNARRKVLQCPLDGPVASNALNSDGGNAFDIRRDFRNGTHIGRANDTQPERTQLWTRLPFTLPAYSLYIYATTTPNRRARYEKGVEDAKPSSTPFLLVPLGLSPRARPPGRASRRAQPEPYSRSWPSRVPHEPSGSASPSSSPARLPSHFPEVSPRNG